MSASGIETTVKEPELLLAKVGASREPKGFAGDPVDDKGVMG